MLRYTHYTMNGGDFMKWKEVRALYQNQWVKLSVLNSHVEEDKKIIDDMEVIKTISSDLEASRELGKCKENEAVYHTYHEDIYYRIKKIFGFRTGATK